MTDTAVIQYVGFQTNGEVREYAFTLRGLGGASSEYSVAIPNVAFVEHRVRYQDAPDICSLKLRREFASQPELPASSQFRVTDAELADYKDSHTAKAKTGAVARKKDQGF